MQIGKQQPIQVPVVIAEALHVVVPGVMRHADQRLIEPTATEAAQPRQVLIAVNAAFIVIRARFGNSRLVHLGLKLHLLMKRFGMHVTRVQAVSQVLIGKLPVEAALKICHEHFVVKLFRSRTQHVKRLH